MPSKKADGRAPMRLAVIRFRMGSHDNAPVCTLGLACDENASVQ